MVTGIVEADNEKDAAALLRKKNYFVVTMALNTPQFYFIQRLTERMTHVKSSDVTNFTRQLSTMIVAGLMLPDALSILEKQATSAGFQKIIQDIEQRLISGSSLTDALSRYPNVFSPIFLALIRAGEASGSLDTVLVRLSDTLESQQEFRNKIKGAMIYPIIILIAMIAVIIIMMTVVIPKLTELYSEFEMDLPFTTKILISTSTFTVKNLPFLVIGTAVAVYAFLRWKKTPVGRQAIDTLLLKLPLIGDLIAKITLVEFTRTFSMLTFSGIHILDSLKMLRSSLGNVVFESAITDVASKVEKGFPLGDSFGMHAVFPPILPQMIRVGEETGKLHETMMKLSEYFQSESEHLVKALTAAIEPLIMVVLGVGVGFIVISVITPIYNLTSNFR